MARILIVGCGYVGTPLGVQLAERGHEVFGLRRNVSTLPPQIQRVRGDVGTLDGFRSLPSNIDFVFYTVGAKARDRETYRRVYLDGMGRLLQVLGDEGQAPERIFFTSSTSVYGQRRGEWVDEISPTHPQDFPGEIMVATESLLQSHRHPSTVLRLGGIYGPGRTRFVSGVREGQRFALPPGPHYSNRIHRDDAVGALVHLLSLAHLESTYLGVDGLPADRRAVLQWIAGRLGVELLTDEVEGSARGAGRRCRNDLIRSTGYAFSYPTFKEGYGSLIGAEESASA